MRRFIWSIRDDEIHLTDDYWHDWSGVMGGCIEYTPQL